MAKKLDFKRIKKAAKENAELHELGVLDAGVLGDEDCVHLRAKVFMHNFEDYQIELTGLNQHPYKPIAEHDGMIYFCLLAQDEYEEYIGGEDADL